MLIRNKNWFIVIAQAIITFFYTVVIESVASGKVLFLNGTLTTDAEKKILSSAFWVTIILGALTLILTIFSNLSDSRRNSRSNYDRICAYLFNKYIRTNDEQINQHLKVSVLLLELKWTYNVQHRFYFGREKVLRVRGRFQTKQGHKTSDVVFKPNEGCAGISYFSNVVTRMTIQPFDKSNPEVYYTECEEKLSLSIAKAKKLHDKACAFICVPIKYFQSENVFAVLSIDSMGNTQFTSEQIRDIEHATQTLSIAFQKSSND